MQSLLRWPISIAMLLAIVLAESNSQIRQDNDSLSLLPKSTQSFAHNGSSLVFVGDKNDSSLQDKDSIPDSWIDLIIKRYTRLILYCKMGLLNYSERLNHLKY